MSLRLSHTPLLWLGLGLVLLAWLFGGGAPLTLAYLVAGVTVLAFLWTLLAAALIRARLETDPSDRLGSAREAPHVNPGAIVVQRGDRAGAKVQLVSRLPWGVSLAAQWPAGDERTAGSEVLGPFARQTVAVATRPLERGIYTLDPAAVVWQDPFGLFGMRRRVGAPTQVIVRPRVHDFAHTALEREWQRATRPGHLSPADVTNWEGIRPYRTGDDRRLIHWRTSVRRGSPQVMEFRQAPGTSIVVVVDRRPGPDEDAWEAAIEAAASLGYRAVAHGHQVWLGPTEQPSSPLARLQQPWEAAQRLAGLRRAHDPHFAPDLGAASRLRNRPVLVVMAAASLPPDRERQCTRWAGSGIPLLALTFDGPEQVTRGSFVHLRLPGVEALGPVLEREARPE